MLGDETEPCETNGQKAAEKTGESSVNKGK